MSTNTQEPPKYMRYKANKGKKEYHSRARATAACQLDEIVDYEYFKTQQQAVDAGFDPCAKGCIRRRKSKH
jgi:hypothetical protein